MNSQVLKVVNKFINVVETGFLETNLSEEPPRERARKENPYFEKDGKIK